MNRLGGDVLQGVVEEGRDDEVFDWVYREAHVGDQEGRFLYMVRIPRATPYSLPKGVSLEASRARP